MKTLARIFFNSPALLAFACLLSLGFPVSPVMSQDESPSLAEPMFYPPPPDVPRVQFLKRLSSHKDLGGKRKGFSDFLLGELEDKDLVDQPFGLALFEGSLFVTDVRNAGYGVFDLVSGTTRFVQPKGRLTLSVPGSIYIDSDGTRYVADVHRGQVLVFDRNDNFLRVLGQATQFKPHDLLVIGERLYLSDQLTHQVHVLNKLTGEVLFSIGEKGVEDGQFVLPGSLALSPDETLWVVDAGNFRMQQFSMDGEFLSVFGRVGTSPGHFGRPKGLAVDQEGLLWIADAAFENVQVMGPDGSIMMWFAEPGYAPYNINLPTVLKIDYEHVKYFQQYAAEDFEIEFLVLVVNQFGPNKVTVFGFGSRDE